MVHALVIASVGLITVLTGAIVAGARRWNAETRELRKQLEAASRAVSPRTVDFRELRDLPAPVQQFFRTALTEGRPIVAGVHVRHRGTFNMGEATDRWSAFTSDQLIVTQRPGFDWDGRIVMMPGLTVRVHDAYIAGDGRLHASLLGLFTLADLRGTPEMADGELMRFVAEATWYPTALLPSQGVRWQPIDEHSARATMIDGARSVTLRFTFNDSGLVEAVRADARGRMVNGAMVPTPWEGRFWNYQDRDGMQIPMNGEVAWVLTRGARPYWRGHIEAITYRYVD